MTSPNLPNLPELPSLLRQWNGHTMHPASLLPAGGRSVAISSNERVLHAGVGLTSEAPTRGVRPSPGSLWISLGPDVWPLDKPGELVRTKLVSDDDTDTDLVYQDDLDTAEVEIHAPGPEVDLQGAAAFLGIDPGVIGAARWEDAWYPAVYSEARGEHLDDCDLHRNLALLLIPTQTPHGTIWLPVGLNNLAYLARELVNVNMNSGLLFPEAPRFSGFPDTTDEDNLNFALEFIAEAMDLIKVHFPGAQPVRLEPSQRWTAQFAIPRVMNFTREELEDYRWGGPQDENADTDEDTDEDLL